jgi:hypothetical protein
MKKKKLQNLNLRHLVREMNMDVDIKRLNTLNPFSPVFPDCTSPQEKLLLILRLINSDLTPEQIMKLKGTGRGGMLTKGDVLLALGQIKNAYGSAEKMYTDPLGPSGRRASEVGYLRNLKINGNADEKTVYIDDTP